MAVCDRMPALGKMRRIIVIAAHRQAMTRLDFERRRRIGPVLTKGFSSGKIDGKHAWKNVRQTSVCRWLPQRGLSTIPDKLKEVLVKEASTLWSALTCQRFGRSRLVATTSQLRFLKQCGVKPPQTKAATGRRTPRS